MDAFVVGAGPNGLAAAIVLAGAGKSVRVLEAESTIGGGTRSEALTLPGFIHDICSSVLPLALASPFFRTLPLSDHGLTYDHPPIPLAHPLDDGSAAVLDRSVDVTASGLGGDGAAYRRLMGPTVRHVDLLTGQFLGPPRPSAHLVTIARFGIPALRSAAVLAASRFRTAQARALFVGLGAHSMLSLRRPATASFGLVLAAAGHAYGWPFARGGSQRVADALTAVLRARGGTIATDSRVGRMAQVSDGRRSRATNGRRASAGSFNGFAMGPGSSRSTGHSTARSPGARKPAGKRAPSTWAATSTRWWRPRTRWPRAR